MALQRKARRRNGCEHRLRHRCRRRLRGAYCEREGADADFVARSGNGVDGGSCRGALLQAAVIDAIRRDEPRASLQAVTVEGVPAEPTRIDIRVNFTLIGQNVPMNLVFPFYLDGA